MVQTKKRSAAFERHEHPGVTNFWQNVRQNRAHPFSRHPTMAMYGQQLANESREWSFGKAQERIGDPNPRNWPDQVGQVFRQIVQREQAHRAQLEELAKDIVVQVWGIPKNKLRAELTMNPGEEPEEVGGGGEGGERREPEQRWSEPWEGEGVGELEEGGQVLRRPTAPVAPEVRAEINKRISLNALSQGAALQHFMTAHHLVREKLNEIDPSLLALYDKFAVGSHTHYWLDDIAGRLEEAMGGVAGNTRVVKDEIDEESGAGIGRASFHIEAQAINFPILVQELSKGVMELINLHHLGSLDGETNRKVQAYADHPTDEPWHIQVGPALWRKLLPLFPKGMQHAQIAMQLNRMPPDQLHKLLDLAVTDPPKAKEMMEGLRKAARIARILLASWQEEVAKKYHIPLEKVEQIAGEVPGPAVEWAVASIQDGDIRWPEDRDRLVNAYTFFKEAIGTQQFRDWAQKRGIEKPKNVLNYGLRDIEDYQDLVRKKKEAPSLAQQQREIKQKGARHLGSEGPYSAVQCGGPGTTGTVEDAAKAACYYGQGSRWCTSSFTLIVDGKPNYQRGSTADMREWLSKNGYQPDPAERGKYKNALGSIAVIEPSISTALGYLRYAPIFIIFEDGKPIIQSDHPGKERFQIKDVKDRDVRVPTVSPELQVFMNKIGVLTPRAVYDTWINEYDKKNAIEFLEYQWPMGAKILQQDPKEYEDYREILSLNIAEGHVKGPMAEKWKNEYGVPVEHLLSPKK